MMMMMIVIMYTQQLISYLTIVSQQPANQDGFTFVHQHLISMLRPSLKVSVFV